MTYPFPALVSRLQILCTPAEYQKLMEPHWMNKRHNPKVRVLREGVLFKDPAFQAILPTYTVARCPICGWVYHKTANTYYFIGWHGGSTLGDRFYSGAKGINDYCPHFLGVHQFCHLNDHYPEVYEQYHNSTGEVPYVTDFYFTKDIATYIVLDALPVCSIQNDQFVPTYTVFSLTYFSENEAEVRQRYYKEAFYDERPVDFYPPPAKPIHYDLAHWAEQGLLGWIDWTQPDCPLRLGKGAQIPDVYRNIEGQRCPYDLSIYNSKPVLHCK